jgi:hypothetical protein
MRTSPRTGARRQGGAARPPPSLLVVVFVACVGDLGDHGSRLEPGEEDEGIYTPTSLVTVGSSLDSWHQPGLKIYSLVPVGARY